MSSEALPITTGRFAAAIKDLPLSTLHLKAAELRNSIAHLDYSNEQMKPFAEGTAPESVTGEKDMDCVEAIRENEGVIERMMERLKLLREEVEGRGGVWGIWEKEDGEGEGIIGEGNEGDSTEEEGRSDAWRDGTFTTGRIVGGEVVMDGVAGAGTNGNVSANTNVNGTTNTVINGDSRTNGTTGGRLDDEALRRAMEERMREDAGDEEDGMHL